MCLLYPTILVDVDKNVYDILKDAGDDPAEVGGIIWSHYHLVSRNRHVHIECNVDYETGSYREPFRVSSVH
jgi:hypothetical protein